MSSFIITMNIMLISGIRQLFIRILSDHVGRLTHMEDNSMWVDLFQDTSETYVCRGLKCAYVESFQTSVPALTLRQIKNLMEWKKVSHMDLFFVPTYLWWAIKMCEWITNTRVIIKHALLTIQRKIIGLRVVNLPALFPRSGKCWRLLLSTLQVKKACPSWWEGLSVQSTCQQLFLPSKGFQKSNWFGSQ